jgi:hypothetical protein
MKLNPHGDASIYDAMCRMAQPWSLRYPLVDGQGNFGSMDGDSPAAMRYTEARMRKITDEVMADIDKDTVDFVYNFDDREILIKSFCAHGYGKGSTTETPVFSNEVGSYCSSIGKYVISGYRKMVRIDENCFELKGLDSTNSNAYRRGILIHPSYLVDLCQFSNGVSYIPLGLTSQGCFSINHNALEELAKLYQAQRNKRVLLYAFTTE